MVVYNFKKMASVPPADDLIDIILTRTQVRLRISTRQDPLRTRLGVELLLRVALFVGTVAFAAGGAALVVAVTDLSVLNIVGRHHRDVFF